MNKKAIQKIRLAHRYQKEALIELIPENVRGNVLNIEKELKDIAQGWGKSLLSEAMELFMEESLEDQNDAHSEGQSKKVKKVEIG